MPGRAGISTAAKWRGSCWLPGIALAQGLLDSATRLPPWRQCSTLQCVAAGLEHTAVKCLPILACKAASRGRRSSHLPAHADECCLLLAPAFAASLVSGSSRARHQQQRCGTGARAGGTRPERRQRRVATPAASARARKRFQRRPLSCLRIRSRCGKQATHGSARPAKLQQAAVSAAWLLPGHGRCLCPMPSRDVAARLQSVMSSRSAGGADHSMTGLGPSGAPGQHRAAQLRFAAWLAPPRPQPARSVLPAGVAARAAG